MQQPDVLRVTPTEAELVTKRTPTQDELTDLELAWRVVAHVKSNAIVLVKDGLLVGVGAGQMSRIDSIDALADVGVTCVVSPGGAKRDEEVKAKAIERGMSLFFAATRHFRH